MSNIYHVQWLPISEYFGKERIYVKPVWLRYKNEQGNYDMAMGWLHGEHWQEQYSGVELLGVTDFMELPMMPTKKEWRVFSTAELYELTGKQTIEAGQFTYFLNQIEETGWNIKSFVTRFGSNHQFVIAYKYVPMDKNEEKGVSPSRRIEIAGENL